MNRIRHTAEQQTEQGRERPLPVVFAGVFAACVIALSLFTACGSMSEKSGSKMTEGGSAKDETADGGDSKKEDLSWMEYTRLTNEETAEFIRRDDVIVIDVRKPEQYEKGHLRGAVNISYDQFLNGRIDALPDLDQPILVYCDYGGLSGIVGDELVAQGYTQVYDFNGMDYWDGETVTGPDPE